MKLNSKILSAFLTLGGFLITVSVSGQNDKKFIRQGNSKYSDGNFTESEISYRKAIDANKTAADAVFNLGDALYRQSKFEEAGKQFIENAGSTREAEKKANGFYNLGNSLLKANKIEESIEAYKNSLRNNPGNPQAKYNLAYAQDLLKQQQEQKQQQQDKNDKNDKNKEDQNKDNKDQNQQNQENQENQQNKQNQQNQQNQENQNQQQQPQISKEDAQRLLNALANDEKAVQEKVKEAKAAGARVRTLINW